MTALALSTVLVRTLGLAGYDTWSFFFVLIGYQGQFDLGLSVADVPGERCSNGKILLNLLDQYGDV